MMTPPLSAAALPSAMHALQSESLFVMQLGVRPPVIVGDTPRANRRIGLVDGGAFEGAKLRGRILDGSSDWLDIRDGGVTTLDARLVLRTDDDVTITMSYRGIRIVEADVQKCLDAGEEVDPARYYFRIAPVFEAPSGKYEWLNRALFVGVGQRLPSGPVYHVFEIR